MTKSYFDNTDEVKAEIKSLINGFNLSDLYKKSAYKNQFQIVNLKGSAVEIEIRQRRLYENIFPHKTNCVGDILVTITYADSEDVSEYKFDDLKYQLSWEFENYNFRLIVPSRYLGNSEFYPFIQLLIAHQNPIVPTDYEQIVYYNDLESAASTVAAYGFKIENKGGNE